MTNLKKPAFAVDIKATIDRLKLTEKQAADYLGVPVFTLRKWLTGERAPSAATRKLIEVMGMLEAMAPAIHVSLLPKK